MTETHFDLSHKILDKLSVLNYQKKFTVKKHASILLPPDYFAIEMNASEQFDFFKSLVKWLFSANNIDTSSFSAYSDPVSVCTNIIEELEKAGMETADLQPIKLKVGYGYEVCLILDFLLKKLFKDKSINIKTPIFPKPEKDKPMVENYEDVEDELEIADNIEIDDVEENDDMLAREEGGPVKRIIETEADEKEWYRECERVANNFMINKVNERNEWRMHVDLSKNYSKKITALNNQTIKGLEKIADTVDKSLKKIKVNENMLNNALSDYFQDLKGTNSKKKEVDYKIQKISQRIKDLSKDYSNAQNKCEELQKKLDEQNNTATNDEALIKIRKTIDDIKLESTRIDIRIGVISNLVLSKQFRDKRNKLEYVLGGPAVADDFEIDENLVEELV